VALLRLHHSGFQSSCHSIIKEEMVHVEGGEIRLFELVWVSRELTSIDFLRLAFALLTYKIWYNQY
jgi:hypothetical protein